MYKVNFDFLNSRLGKIWDEIFSRSMLIQAIHEERISKELFAIYMLETYQYTKHNPRNQALVGARNISIPHKYRSYCYKHAREETGHEEMALSDVRALGFELPDVELLKPLPATETLIAYLYWISSQGNPVQRLGYSYWAENCYRYINPTIEQLSRVLSLQKNQLSFFIAHSSIDEKHAKEVTDMITLYCKSDDDYNDICRVMETSLYLTGKILSNVYVEYEQLLRGDISQYQFLRN